MFDTKYQKSLSLVEPIIMQNNPMINIKLWVKPIESDINFYSAYLQLQFELNSWSNQMLNNHYSYLEK